MTTYSNIFNVTEDPQVIGWMDDGTNQGVIRTVEYGNLVPVEFRHGQIGSANFGEFWGYFAGESELGTGHLITLNAGTTVPAAAGATIKTTFRGTVFGLLYDGTTLANGTTVQNGDIGVMIDGIAYRAKIGTPYDGTSLATGQGNFGRIVATGLPDGTHTAYILIPPNATAQSAVIYGMLLEQRCGYQPPPRAGFLLQPVAVPTASLTSIGVTAQGYRQYRSLRKIFYTNTTAGDITVEVQTNSVDIYAALDVPANSTTVLDFGGPVTSVADSSGLRHKASGSGLTYTVVGIL